jgi:FkbM family methyltransferase
MSRTAPRLFRLPNGHAVYGLSQDDTLGIYREIFDDRCYRRHGVTICDGDCVLDVGANTGLFVLYLNTLCSRARIFAFEPVPAIFGVLRRNIKAHNHLDVRLFNVGLSSRSGSAAFAYYPRFSQASTMYPDRSARAARRDQDYLISQLHSLPWPLPFVLSRFPSAIQHAIAERVRRYYLHRQSVTCNLWTLSAFLREWNIGVVDLLKIDAEQSEHDILAGLDEGDWSAIRQVVVEVHQGEEATRAIVALLSRHGFRTAIDPNPAMPGLDLVYGTRRAGE